MIGIVDLERRRDPLLAHRHVCCPVYPLDGEVLIVHEDQKEEENEEQDEEQKEGQDEEENEEQDEEENEEQDEEQKEGQEDLKIEDLSVIFIQSTLAVNHTISKSGADLMFQWLTLLSAVFQLNNGHIHPFIFFVKQPTIQKFSLLKHNNSESFIPTNNVWVMDGHARESSEDHHALTGQLLLSYKATLESNTNSNHFRCYFCNRILTEFFPNHHCRNIQKKMSFSLDRRTEDTFWNLTPTMFEEPSPNTQTSPPTPEQPPQEHPFVPKFVFDLIWSRQRDRNPDSDELQRQLIGIDFVYPDTEHAPTFINRLGEFDIMTVEMVRVGEQTVSPLSVISTSNEKDKAKLRLTFSHSDPIPTIFTYFPRRQEAPQTPQPTISLLPVSAFCSTETRHIVLNEF
ncbi:hypothetical protein BLNAU_10545 [Blattamonas nauphoetae]|uniref:Uncharacterized protein n=1 Tax=Blattamonas nauphoetae TaxID=2049346 RepID=A0ABQ9XSF8_9EUKA|nr:hypothetical protein BLNAU_10545 [Blattamonas nauphoetae]